MCPSPPSYAMRAKRAVSSPSLRNQVTSLLPEKARGFWHGIEGERKQNSQRETYHCDQLGESSVMASIFFLA